MRSRVTECQESSLNQEDVERTFIDISFGSNQKMSLLCQESRAEVTHGAITD